MRILAAKKKPEPAGDAVAGGDLNSLASGVKTRTENPYTNAKRAWNSHVGGVVSERDTARVLAMTGLLIALLAVGGAIYFASRSTFVPYVVEVDKLGRQQAVGFAAPVTVTDPRIVRAAVEGFIEHARMVTIDGIIQRNAILSVYAHLSTNDPAFNKMNEWMNGSEDANPHKRATKELVAVEIDTALPQSDSTWQVEWVETVRDRQGAVKSKFRMRALVTVYQVPQTPQTTEEDIRKNPGGLYVRDFSWSKQS